MRVLLAEIIGAILAVVVWQAWGFWAMLGLMAATGIVIGFGRHFIASGES